MKNLTPEEKKQYRKLIAAAVGFVLVIGILSLLCMPLSRRLSDPGNQEQLRAWIDSLGFTGWLILLGVQILQIVIAFIPGEPVELLAGALYGAWGGLLTCFILFLIPGTPKDMLTYLAGVSKIRPAQFLLISTFARIPSIITSTWMGASVSRGNWGMAIVVFLLTAAIGLVGILYKQRVMDWLHRLHKEH